MVVAVGKELPNGDDPNNLSIAIIVFGAIALYNVLELNYMVLWTFRKRRGLYFWSLVVATWGIAVNSIGYLLEHLQLINQTQIYSTLIVIGWICMVTGQSVVLYSRLHLVMPDEKRLRAVLWMIIINAVVLHIPVTVLVYGSNSSNPAPFFKTYSIYEKIQLTIFFLQETIISGLYVWETVNLLRFTKDIRGKRGARRVLNHLIFVNIVVIMLDISILGLEFSDYYNLQTGYKPLVYSIKLKMELSILNQLVELTRASSQASFSMSNSNGDPATPAITLDTLQSTQQRRARRDRDMWDVEMGSKVNIVGHNDPNSRSSNAGVLRSTEFSVQHQRSNSARDTHGFLASAPGSAVTSENDPADDASASSYAHLTRLGR
ncbi:uncharacterized protein JN550_013075 [Neoarthrinium moseri]|uniref:uncharacterized protein n=1 Tax=Neoarthrinium moseri TaxID=1658444 RepID=UPI001FDD6E9B|nr:uncharacterized protein JN550_013075 [Neoarthrinium moseri]KAI1857739.1 hypothetical protein JN550_013075 [Neoarthrinium moseri]